jgi:hypothetical protein
MLARTIIALLVSSGATTLALLFAVTLPDPSRGGLLGGAALALLVVTGFCALGLCAVVGCAMLLMRRRTSFVPALITLTAAGTVLGYVLLMWAQNSWVGCIAGAFTAALWTAFNRGLFPQSHTP